MMSNSQRQGRVFEITSTANPIIKSIRTLDKKRNRDEEGIFLAEGLKHVIDALEQGWRVRQVIYAKSMKDHELTMTTAARARAGGADILEVSEKVLSAITKRDNPQAVLAIVEQKWQTAEALIAAHKQNEQTLLVLDRVRDPGNLGTILRTVDGAGGASVILVGESTDPFALEAVRASMGSLFHVALAKCSEADFLSLRPSLKGAVLGTHLEGSVDWREPDYAAQPVTLIMGNERAGMTPELAESCTQLIRIPMAGGADSLNLAVATGIAIYEARRHLLSTDQSQSTRKLTYER